MQLDIAPLVNALVDRLKDQLVDDEVLDLKGAAKLLKVSVSTVSVLARRGEIPGRRLGSAWRFTRKSLLEAMAKSSEYDGY